MTSRDWFLFGSTLLIGLFTGMYLYFTTFIPEYVANPAVQEFIEEPEPTLTILAQAYGGCEMSGQCPSYELIDTRAYRYHDGADTIREGSIPRNLMAAITKTVTEADLVALEQPAEKSCAHFVDGVDYEFSVILETETYDFDTCYSVLDRDDPLSVWLQEVFVYADDPQSYVTPNQSDASDRRGVSGYIEQKLDDHFDYDEQ